MNKFFTIMIVPERGKGVKSFRIPHLVFRVLLICLVFFIFILAILAYDYFEILKEVHKNKHLNIENRYLKEQVDLFEKKIDTLISDIHRIEVFEKKLRIIVGLENKPLGTQITDQEKPEEKIPEIRVLQNKEYKEQDLRYQKLKSLHKEKVASLFGLNTSYAFTENWSELTKQSFKLAEKYASFDYQLTGVEKITNKVELDIHTLDQFVLDKQAFLRSTPTLLPTNGWITSNFGIRTSHFSGREKMHEGIDIGARIGSPIISPADGIIKFAGKKPGFGYLVQIDHGFGLETVFAHASKLIVEKGNYVKRGMIIAKVGSTGLSTGPHVHYEVRVNGTPIDPMFYILD